MDGDSDKDTLNTLQRVSAIMKEITKGKCGITPEIEDDCGTSLGVGKQRDPDVFWKVIYAYGDTLCIYEQDDGVNVYGATAMDMLNMERRIAFIPVNGTLARDILLAQKLDLRSSEYLDFVRGLGICESVPPWKKSKWDNLIDCFVPCKSFEDSQPHTHFDDRAYRFAFTHQASNRSAASKYTESIGKKIEETKEFIRNVIAEGKFDEITEFYRNKHFTWEKESEKSTLNKTDAQKKILQRVAPNFGYAKKSLSGLGKFVKVVKIYECMQSVVTVCEVEKHDMQSLVAKINQWVDVMVYANTIRQDYKLAVSM